MNCDGECDKNETYEVKRGKGEKTYSFGHLSKIESSSQDIAVKDAFPVK